MLTDFWRFVKHTFSRLHEKTDATHRKLDSHAELHANHAESLRELHQKLDRVLEVHEAKPKPPPSDYSGKAVE